MYQPKSDRVAPERAVGQHTDGPTSVEIMGPLHHAQFPKVCVKCGTSTTRTLPVTKLFWRASTRDRPSYYVIGEVDAPFCPACIRTHERELQPIEPGVKRRLLRKWLVQALPYLFALGVNLWFVSIMAPKLLEALTEGGELWEILIWGGLCAFFGLLAMTFYRMIRDRGRRLILEPENPSQPRYVQVESGLLGSRFIVPTEPTSVLAAVDFTDDRSELFDTERHLFTFENVEVRAKFAELNANRKWEPTSTRARIAQRTRWTLMIGFLLVGLYLILKDLFQ
jgi:hypothetical protein